MAPDFNSDGKTDLLVNYPISFTQIETKLLLGNGDGTFRHGELVNLPGSSDYDAGSIATGDFNSDGLLDFIFQEPGEVTVIVRK